MFPAFDFCVQRTVFVYSVSLVGNRIYGLVLCANIYIRVCLAYVRVDRTHEKKWTPNWEKNHRAEKIASIRGKKPYVYRVIILN